MIGTPLLYAKRIGRQEGYSHGYGTTSGTEPANWIVER